MRVKIFAVAALVVTLSFVAVNTVMLVRGVDGFCREVCELDVCKDGAYDEAVDIYGRFGRWETFISMTVSHDDLTNIESGFAEMIGMLEIGDTEGAAVAKSRLKDSFRHLRRLVGINLDSII